MNDATGVLWRRLRYMLTPQFDLYQAIAGQVSGLSVIDVGCGTGFGTLQLARAAKDVTGIDLDADAVRFADASFPGVRFEHADILERGWTGGRLWDVVVMVEVLEHIPAWRDALNRVCNLLAPGGQLILTTRNANADLRRVELHEREWTAGETLASLGEFFSNVHLYDYTLERELSPDARVTPLISVASGHETITFTGIGLGTGQVQLLQRLPQPAQPERACPERREGITICQ